MPIERANYLFRAVVVPEGDQTVALRYRPRSAAIGLGVTVLSCRAAVALARRGG